MIGSKQIVIEAADFVQGMSMSEEVADAGLSPESSYMNPTVLPGALYGSAGAVDKSTNLTGEAIAYCPTNIANLNGYLLDSGGKIYSIDSSQALAASSALTGTWLTGTSDIVQFIDKIYATSTTDVARMDTNLTNGDHDWWSSTQGEGVLTSGCRHPLLIYQDRLWVGDLNALHKITDSGTSDQDVLVLSSHWEITALGVDPSSGKMLIACTQGANYSNTLSSGNVVFTWDGTSATYTREYAVDGMVTGFRSVGGVTYVAYGGTKIGYWNGSGITFLRKLRDVTLAGADLPYKHHLTNIDNTLYVVDGKKVLAYGEILPGRKVWYYYTFSYTSAKMSLLCHVGSGKLGYATATSKFFTTSTTDYASSDYSPVLDIFTNKYKFQRPIYLRNITIEYVGAVVNNDNNRNLYYFTNVDPSSTQVATISNTSGSSIRETADIIGMANDKVRWVQLRYIASPDYAGLRRIIIYYDPAE